MRLDDPELRDLVESNREPRREEIGALMRRFLAEPVDDEAIDRLHEQFRALVADTARRQAGGSAFRANGRRYLGQAWKELLSPHEHLPSRAELALWLAIVTPEYPRPRPYCPEEVAGNWISATGASWSLDHDGGFLTSEALIARDKAVRWCVHLVTARGDLRRDQLWLLGGTRHNTLHTSLLILECTSSTLRLLQSRGDFDNIEYRLSRAEAVST